MTVDTKEFVSKIAFLIGVKEDILIRDFEEDGRKNFDLLSQNKSAVIIRSLCRLRTALLQNYRKCDDAMRFDMRNIDRQDWFDKGDIENLRKYNIEVVKANYRSEKYILLFTELISNNIESCAGLFYDWQRWDLVRELFRVPRYNKDGTMKAEFDKYQGNLSAYPYQMYIYWQPRAEGNILFSDKKFLEILLSMHGEKLEDKSLVRDAHEDVKNSIYDFIEDSGATVIAVDCENSDAFKFVSVLKNLNPDELSKIKKITLYDDYHTSSAWDWLRDFTKVPVEHVEVDRVTDRKSLVDIKMSAEICHDYYVDHVDSFILLSSDSDYWGLITSLPDAHFLVMYEYDKCGSAIKAALGRNGYYYCAIDDFCSGNTEDFRKRVLFSDLRSYLPDFSELNGRVLAKKIYEDVRIPATEKEVQQFFLKYIKTLRLKVDDNGEMSIEIAGS